MKKLFLMCASLVLCLAAVSCGGGDNNGGQTNVGDDDIQLGYDGSAVTIKFDHTMGQSLRGVLEEYILEFNDIYPNITIKHEQVGSYDDVRDNISKQLTVGNSPNIAYCYPDHVALYNSAKAVQTLDSFINSEVEVERADGTTEILGLTAEQKADFIAGYYAEGAQFGDGLMYSMPFSKSTEVLYYNKDFFTANNIPLPTHWFSADPNNIEADPTSMEAVCKRIKEIDPTSIPLGYDSESNWFITMCEQLGSPYTQATGDKFLFNNATNKDFCKKFRGWYLNNWVTTQELYGAYTSGLFTATEGAKSYMSIGSSAGATHQRPGKDDNGNYLFEVGITSIPQVDANNPKVISQGPSVCIFKKDNVQEVIASWLFVKFLTTSVDFQAAFSMTSGYVPVIKSVATHPIYANFLEKADGGNNVAALSAKVCIDQEHAYFTSPAFSGSSKAREEVGTLLQNILAGNKEADEAGVNALIDSAFADAIKKCQFFSN